MKGLLYAYGVCLVVVLWSACKEDVPDNPFEGQIAHQDTVDINIVSPEPASIAGIYQNILRPTCANVGCHDGTFEPDYRTLGSAYNTLVYQTPIKNDGNYTYRVEPYQPSRSVLMARLRNQITPAMPIQVDPGSDWPQKMNEYIQHIETWISQGAPDITGSVRQIGYPTPELMGAGMTISDQWVDRLGVTGPIAMPSGTVQCRLYLAFHHDQMDPALFAYNKVAFSSNPNSFAGAIERDLQILATPRMETGFYGNVVAYTHYIDLQPMGDFDVQQDQWYFRAYVQDDQNPVTILPGDNGIFYVKSYMSFRRVP